MTRLPRHRVSDISEIGIRLRLFSPDNIRETPVNYVHQDDYYIFGFIESGTCNIRIDFKDYELAVNKTALVLPGQVHCFTHSDQLSAYLLMIDSAFVEETSQRAFEQYTLTSQLICLSPQQQTKLKSLFAILSDNQSLPGNRSQALNLHVSLAIIDISQWDYRWPAYLLTIVTAIILILQKGPADIHWDLLHYQVGILFSILGLCHLISRLKFLLNHFCLGK